MLVIKDRIKETNSATGTNTFVLTGAVSGSRSFADVGDGNQTFYGALDSGAGTWETGEGTYTLSGTTLSRDTVSSNSLGTTAKISFASAPVVFGDFNAFMAALSLLAGVTYPASLVGSL